MAADVLGFDVFKANAYTEGPVKFDLFPARQSAESPVNGATDVTPAPPEDLIASINPEVCSKTSPPKDWEIDVRGLISTRKWLQNYGLKKNRLDIHHLLPQIGFKHSDDYDPLIKKPICSRYGLKLFQRYFRSDGKTFNLACTKEQLKQIESRLTQAICLYKRRLEWLTTESRRIFGVLQEKSIAIVLDIRTMSPQQFDQYRSAVERLLKEQVSQLAKFNLIRASEDLISYSTECVPVSQETIESAIEWLWSLDRCSPISTTATCESIMKASSDSKVEAIYMVTEGGACDGSRELLKEKLTGARIPVHIVSFNCNEANTINFLKNLCKITGGRFHAYAVIMEMDSYEGQPVDPHTNQANVLLKRKTYGGVPPGAGMREDVISLFEELEEARNNLAQIQGLVDEYPDPKPEEHPTAYPHLGVRSETYMSSREWISKYGLKAKKLGFYDILAGVAFKHQDGVVDIKKAPGDEFYQTDAVTTRKLVNARYCDKFPHVRWKDGQVVHVQVSPEIHRGYEQRMTLALEAVQQRIDWLQQGSREVFGTVIEDQIYFLIDTSSSMAPHIQFVKDKLFVLMQEQLRHKQKFNLVSFDTKGCPWRDRLVDVNEKNLHGAWQWIKTLSCRGSTNTLAALRQALSDPQTQAIYLLTDGRPDQPPKSVLAQVHLHPNVPIHTISFNCADKEANEFLCSLAKDTGGRFHYYAENGIDFDGPEPWESEDIRLLKQEYESGLQNLEKIATLRDECAALAWKKDTDFSGNSRKCSREHILSARDRESAVPSLNSRDLYRPEPILIERPHSAPGIQYTPAPPGGRTPRPSTAHGYRPSTGHHHKARTVTYSPRAISARSPRSRSFTSRSYGSGPIRPLTAAPTGRRPNPSGNVAGHTRTSILRVLNGGGRFEDREWLLPETRSLFDRQWERQQTVMQNEKRKKTRRAKNVRKMTDSKTMSSKQWLTKHGLVAKKLTILDALAPTFIPHKAKYVPIIGKQVNSRVFDDLMPIAHTVGEKGSMTIVNPQGVDLDAYQRKVEDAVEKYQQRLDRMVWDALPESEREQFNSRHPVSYMENKTSLLQALENCSWPIREKDVILLEGEIKQGEHYIEQAQKLLKETASSSARRGSISDGDDGNASDKETPRSHRGRKDSSRSPRGHKDSARDASPASARSEKSNHSAGSGDKFEGMGEALQGNTPRKEKNTTLTKHKVRRVLDTLRGQKVIGRNEADGFYYPGLVIRCPNSRHALVEFNELGQKTVPTRFVIPTGGAIAQPHMQVGDFVLARVINNDTDLECYVPGIVQVVPARCEAQAKFYTVVLYTSQQAHFLRSFLVKISKMRFTFLVRHIAEVSKREEEEERKHEARCKDKSLSKPNLPKKRVRYADENDSVKSQSESGSDSDDSVKSRSQTGSDSDSASSTTGAGSSVRADGRRSRRKNKPRSPRRSRSRSRSRSGSTSRSSSRSRSRSSYSSRSSSYTRSSRSRSSSGSRSRPSSPVEEGRGRSSSGQRRQLERWQRDLREQQRKQDKQQQQLRKQAKKLADLQEGLETSRSQGREGQDQERLLEVILQQLNKQRLQPDTGRSRQKKHLTFEGDISAASSEEKTDSSEAVSQFALEMRRTLCSLQAGVEVLARWSDEGWYYRGTVKQNCGDGSYFVEDSVGDLEKIWREDILTDSDEADVVLKGKDAVIALHPSYSFSYAPGVVLEVGSDLWTQVRFYDGAQANLPREEVYKIPGKKFETDVAYIVKCEDQWVGQTVVARNDDAGYFQLGSVRERVGNGRQYVIEWSDGKLSVQNSAMIFGAFTRRHRLAIGDHALAIADTSALIYLPGWITGNDAGRLIVKFCDGSISNSVDPSQCFWLSQDYYDTAASHYANKQGGGAGGTFYD